MTWLAPLLVACSSAPERGEPAAAKQTTVASEEHAEASEGQPAATADRFEEDANFRETSPEDQPHVILWKMSEELGPRLAEACDDHLSSGTPFYASVRLRLARDADPDVEIEAEQTAPDGLEACILETVRTVELPQPRTPRLEVLFHAEMRRGAVDVHPPLFGPSVVGGLTEEQVATALKDAPTFNKKRARCETPLGEKDSGGVLFVYLDVRKDGEVERVRIPESSVLDRSVEECMMEVYGDLTFPPSDAPTEALLPRRYLAPGEHDALWNYVERRNAATPDDSEVE